MKLKLVKAEKLHYKRLSKGCKQCIYGRKSVLFITSRCHYSCFYCPISNDKREKEIVKINEKVIKHPDGASGIKDLIHEITLCQSTGVGITGGDPLATIERTIRYIKELKKHFGRRFHIHLYTSPQFVTRVKLEKLSEAGLNEIRFHLNIESDALWERANLAKGLGMRVGVEIPAVPSMLAETKKVLDFCKKSPVIKFINLNELEYSDASVQDLQKRKMYTKNDLSYAIKHSETVAQELVLYGKEINFPTHYCSAQFKDSVQLANRIRLRAESVKRSFEELDEEGMITRGEIEGKQKKLSNRKLVALGLKAEELFSIPKKYVHVENNKLLIHPDALKEAWPLFDQVMSKKELKAAILTEYPTDDHLLVEKHPMK